MLNQVLLDRLASILLRHKLLPLLPRGKRLHNELETLQLQAHSLRAQVVPRHLDVQLCNPPKYKPDRSVKVIQNIGFELQVAEVDLPSVDL